MDFQDLKNKSQAELQELLLQLHAELHALELKAHTKQLKQVHKISQTRKNIARIMTLVGPSK